MPYCAICNYNTCCDRNSHIPESSKLKYFKDEYTRARTNNSGVDKQHIPERISASPDISSRADRGVCSGGKASSKQSDSCPDIGNQPHYASLSPQPIEVIEQWGLTFHPAQAIKYIARAGNKPGNTRESDIRKAIWYLKRWLGPGEQPLVVG